MPTLRAGSLTTGSKGRLKLSKSVECVCESCENKELCPVYTGQSCLLVKEHEEGIAGTRD